MNTTEACGIFIENFELSSVTQSAIEHTKNAIIDTIGVMIAAKDEPVVTKLLKYLEQAHLLQQEGGQSTIIPFSYKTNARDAAWVMGTLAHALDFDDTSLVMKGHPSAILIPAILSLSEKYNRSGKEVLEGYICGLEVTHQLAKQHASHQYNQGWHTTATYGTLGAAAASAKIIGLSQQQIRYALGIAASSASGLRANFGTMTKPLHAGQAAAAGVFAALLAEQDVTANSNVLEADFGYGDVFHHDQDFGNLSFSVDSLYLESHGLNVKMYPSCSMTHRPIDAVFSLITKHQLDPEQLETIKCSISKRAASILRYHQPKDEMEAKFSLEYCIASAVLNQEVSLAQFHDDQVKRTDIQRMMKQVIILAEEDTEEEKATVTIKTKKGDIYTKTITHPIGSSQKALSRAQLKQKFSECVNHIMTDEQQHSAFAYLEKLEEIDDIRGLLDSLTLKFQKN